jgi:hypothetical protein
LQVQQKVIYYRKDLSFNISFFKKEISPSTNVGRIIFSYEITSWLGNLSVQKINIKTPNTIHILPHCKEQEMVFSYHM